MRIVQTGSGPSFAGGRRGALRAAGAAACVALASACLALPAAAQAPGPAGEAITIAAVGDIMLASPFPNESRMPPDDGRGMLKAVTPLLAGADIAFGNMEGPIIDDGASSKCAPASTRCFAFRMPTRYARYLKEAGFDVLSVANNHASDFGEAGRASTRRTLDDLGIRHVGSDMRHTTAVLEAKGRKVAFVGFAHNPVQPNVNDLATARRLVQQAKQQADLVVVSFHGGAEGPAAQRVVKGPEPFYGEARGDLPAFAHAVIDAGADLVVGHGPHVLRALELYKGRLVAYSLGNFATYGWFQLSGETALTTVLEVKLAPDGRFVGGRLNAARLEGRGIPVLDADGAAVAKVRELSRLDFPGASPDIAADGTLSVPR